MFEYVGNILCIKSNALYNDEDNILSYSYYKQLNCRKQINLVRKGGNGRYALVEYDSLPQRFKSKIEEKIGGDPHRTTKRNAFKDLLKTDHEAVKYYENYILENGRGLPVKRSKEYVANASILNAIAEFLEIRNKKQKARSRNSATLWQNFSEAIHDLPRSQYPHSLPANHRRLKAKFKTYQEVGYSALVHKGYANKNAEKVNPKAQVWVIARWADQVNKCVSTKQLWEEYNVKADREGWKPLKDAHTLYLFLNQPENKQLWYGHRYGELKSKEQYSYQQKTALPTMRDSLWYSDGTKLNYFYLGENGKIETCQVYEVMDAYSEVMLGYHISKTEDYEAQYYAYKMALKVSGQKPYQVGFDGQGGHKKLVNGDFLSKIARLSVRTEPYNGKSKSIESVFGRFQQQCLKKDWFFTGQNITAKKQESKLNAEFLEANRENLPALKEVEAVYEKRRTEWNMAPHPKTGIPRAEMYRESENSECVPLTMWEMVDIFWITRDAPVTVTASGISFKEKKVLYEYVVTKEGTSVPDVEWLRNHVGKKVWVKCDPEDRSMVHVYTKDALGLRHLTEAHAKVEIHRGIQEQEDWEREFYEEVRRDIQKIRLEKRNEMDQMLREENRHAEGYGLNTPRIKGLEKNKRNKKKNKQEDFRKVESNIVVTPGKDKEDDMDVYSMM
ncbi:MAG: kinase [Crocinitomicaceae bacterium]|nr:kinase [Crocinitomicaceae bacterium]|tara:strand:- start:12991 stop:15006 length:2016 start_codon:yes stop_codon:yes gene_type:complete